MAKKAVIKAVRPTINLDGKGKTYINAMFDLACDDVNSRTVKDTNYQRKQMFNGDSKSVTATPSAETARQKMIERSLNKTNKEDK